MGFGFLDWVCGMVVGFIIGFLGAVILFTV